MKVKTKQKPGSSISGKRTRGYRLKPSTHLLIVKIQDILQSDQDEAIAGACTMFYSEIKKNKTIRIKK